MVGRVAVGRGWDAERDRYEHERWQARGARRGAHGEELEREGGARGRDGGLGRLMLRVPDVSLSLSIYPHT